MYSSGCIQVLKTWKLPEILFGALKTWKIPGILQKIMLGLENEGRLGLYSFRLEGSAVANYYR